MLNITRQNTIYEYIRKHYEVRVSTLVDTLGVSDMTIRRDLSHMESMGLIKRVFGGAVIVDTPFSETTFSSRSSSNDQNKKKIAAKAAEFLSSGASVYIDGSTTCSELAELLPVGMELTIFTNSLALVYALRNKESLHLFLMGGELARDGNTFDGSMVMDIASRIFVDISFFSCSGFSSEGVSNNGIIGTQVKKIILKNSKRNILLADSSKYNRQGLYMLGEWNEVHTLITDKGIGAEATEKLSNRDVGMIICE